MTEPEKRSRGRPPTPPDERLDVKIDGRVTQGQSEKWDAVGRTDWLRALLDRFTVAQLRALLHIKPPKT